MSAILWMSMPVIIDMDVKISNFNGMLNLVNMSVKNKAKFEMTRVTLLVSTIVFSHALSSVSSVVLYMTNNWNIRFPSALETSGSLF
tara:strand:+ start:4373 stop:4633 length:261 start_codon:yes stop_codon:yes gene_type:complete